MAIDPVLTSTEMLNAAQRALSSRASRADGAKRLDELVHTRELVAAQLELPGHSQSERSVLTSRLNNLQRQVNQLDGIVAGEGQESSGPTSAAVTAEVAKSPATTADHGAQQTAVSSPAGLAATPSTDTSAAAIDLVA